MPKNKNYDEGFKSTSEKIVEFIKSHGGSIESKLTKIDRENIKNEKTWHVEFLIPNKNW